MFIPPSPDKVDPPKLPPQPPKLPPPPLGAAYPPFGQATPTSWVIPVVPWFIQPQPIPLTMYCHLCFNHAIRRPVLSWDLIHAPDVARVFDPYDPLVRLKAPDHAKPAFQPPSRKAWITSVNPIIAPWFSRWGPIVVDKKSDDPLTVGDILNAIFSYFSIQLTQEDVDYLSLEPSNKKCLRAVFKLRAQQSHEIEPIVVAGGYRRVDLLGSYRRFKGLDIVALPDNTWRLHLDFLPNPAGPTR